MHFCLLLWKASNIPSRHFNDSCLVFPSSRDSTSSANWTICIQNNSNPFISHGANLHYIHDVFRLPINKLFAYASGKNILSPAQKQPTFWHFEDIWKSERRLLDKNRNFWREFCTICRQIVSCKMLFATFCIRARPGKPCESWYVQIRLGVRRLAGIWFSKLSQKIETYSHTVRNLIIWKMLQ